jgi:hypothetical protein
VEIDRTLLNQEQQSELDSWLELFASPGWKQYLAVQAPKIRNAHMRYDTIVGEQALGFNQGAMSVYMSEFVNFEDTIMNSFLLLTGQLLGADGEGSDDPENPVQPNDWNV